MEYPVNAVEEFCGVKIRILSINDSAWVVASDLAEALDYYNAQGPSTLVASENKIEVTCDSTGRLIFNTDGLNSISERSTKEYADTLSDWVEDRVLPALEDAKQDRPGADVIGQPVAEVNSTEDTNLTVHENGEADEPSENGEALTQYPCFEDHEIRIIVGEKRIWIVAKDVADALGMSRTQHLTQSVRDKYKGYYNVVTPGGEQEMVCISKPGLWQVLGSIRGNEIAERFQDWLYEEVVPSIEKTGGYQLNGQSQQALEEMSSEALLQKANDVFSELGSRIGHLSEQVINLNERLEEVEDACTRPGREMPYVYRSGQDMRTAFNRAVKSYARQASISKKDAYIDIYSSIKVGDQTLHDAAKERGISKIEMLDRDGQLEKALRLVEELIGNVTA